MVHARTAEEPYRADVNPTPDEVRTQLKALLSSPAFNVPERARKFLSYIVEQTLSGSSDRIKAYTIAVEVFGRSAAFDPQNDPIVRLEAARLRQALEKYYLTGGVHDPLRIAVPKGSYVPTFQWMSDTLPTEAKQPIPDPVDNAKGRSASLILLLGGVLILVAAIIGVGGYDMLHLAGDGRGEPGETSRGVDAPRLLVEQFDDLGNTPNSAIVARGLTEEVIGQLARFREVVIIAPPRSTDPVTRAPPAEDTPRFRLEGSVRTTDKRLRLAARLVNTSNDQILWSNIYDEKLDVPTLMELQASLARDVALALAQPYGAIFRFDAPMNDQIPSGDWQAYECTLAYYTYRVELKPDDHSSVQNCLQRTTERYPDYATAWALLSLTYSDEIRFKYRLKTDTSDALVEAKSAAEQAVKLDANNVRGMEALLIALYLSGKVDEALAIGARGYAINPNDMEFVGEYGNRLALSGQWTKGCALMLEARNSSPAPPGNIEVSLAVCEYIQGNYQAAEDWIKVAPVESNPVYHFVAAAIAGKLGNERDAEKSRLWIETNAPGMLRDIRREVAMRIIQPKDQDMMLDGLRKAGLSVPQS